jgi:hypothetical protein
LHLLWLDVNQDAVQAKLVVIAKAAFVRLFDRDIRLGVKVYVLKLSKKHNGFAGFYLDEGLCTLLGVVGDKREQVPIVARFLARSNKIALNRRQGISMVE